MSNKQLSFHLIGVALVGLLGSGAGIAKPATLFEIVQPLSVLPKSDTNYPLAGGFEIQINNGDWMKTVSEFEFELPDGERYLAVKKTSSEIRVKNELHWTANIYHQDIFSEHQVGTLSFFTDMESVAAHFNIEGTKYEIRTAGTKTFDLIQYETVTSSQPAQAEQPSHDDHALKKTAQRTQTGTDNVSGKSSTVLTRIDVMALYMEELGQPNILEVIRTLSNVRSAIADANEIFANSGIDIVYNLVHFGPIPGTSADQPVINESIIPLNVFPTADQNDDVAVSQVLNWANERFANPALDTGGIAALRDQVGADLVSIYIPSFDDLPCGRANLPLRNSNGAIINSADHLPFGDRAIAVIERDCPLSEYTYAHEHGHNFGMIHNRRETLPLEDPDQPPSSSNPRLTALSNLAFGVDDRDDTLNRDFTATVMGCNFTGSPTNGSCNRVPYFSQPDTLINGLLIGSISNRDNTGFANLPGTLSRVSGYRPQQDDNDVTAPRIRINDREALDTSRMNFNRPLLQLSADVADDKPNPIVRWYIQAETSNIVRQIGVGTNVSPPNWDFYAGANRVYIVTAEAQDAAGNVSTDSFTIFVESNFQPPGSLWELQGTGGNGLSAEQLSVHKSGNNWFMVWFTYKDTASGRQPVWYFSDNAQLSGGRFTAPLFEYKLLNGVATKVSPGSPVCQATMTANTNIFGRFSCNGGFDIRYPDRSENPGIGVRPSAYFAELSPGWGLFLPQGLTQSSNGILAAYSGHPNGDALWVNFEVDNDNPSTPTNPCVSCNLFGYNPIASSLNLSFQDNNNDGSSDTNTGTANINLRFSGTRQWRSGRGGSDMDEVIQPLSEN